jgi:hypothetical protein
MLSSGKKLFVSLSRMPTRPRSGVVLATEPVRAPSVPQ